MAKKIKPTKTLEQTLWEAADNLRGNQEPSEYKHVVLGLIFLKYISDKFEEQRYMLNEELLAEGYEDDELTATLEDHDEYTADNVFWVPETARWGVLQANAKQPEIGQMIDAAMQAIEQAELIAIGDEQDE
ncbi:type I restriction-modification system subunit M N-terminal domain-containing protein [Corynebacterium durum]|uniref:type I restriction-modification system subunit M N-terminal domain-containing protein n=1 Tax=Corynebacterium durum TaxID=61592 RepID=UPI0028E6A8C0|nr:type I restriction-modification system subunit M N-terminal domain-containing protein [Corynebacterium durum]